MSNERSWGRLASGEAAPDRGLLKEFSFFASKRKGSTSDSASSGQLISLLRAFEASCHGWFWSVDQDGRLTYISDSVASALGTDPASLPGRCFSDVFAWQMVTPPVGEPSPLSWPSTPRSRR
jgi:hypothetical protein